MDVAAIGLLPPQLAADPGALAQDPARLAREFDAMVLRLMLGSMQASMTADPHAGEYGGAAQSLLGGLLVEQLAAAVDLGLGSALLRAGMEEGR